MHGAKPSTDQGEALRMENRSDTHAVARSGASSPANRKVSLLAKYEAFQKRLTQGLPYLCGSIGSWIV